MKTLQTIALISALGFGLFGGIRGCSNFVNYLDIDKGLYKTISMAGATTTAGDKGEGHSMEGLINDSLTYAKDWEGENAALWWKTDLYEFDNLIKVLEDAKQHANDLGMLDRAYTTGQLDQNAPEWVRLTFENAQPDENETLKQRRQLSSELGRIVQEVYEGFNDTVSGGVTIKGEGTSSNMALVDIMDRAAAKSFWNPHDTDYGPMNDAHAHTYLALLYSNMGKLDTAIEHLNTSKEILNQYKDSVDLAIVRSDVRTLTMKDLKGAVDSAIDEFTALNSMDPELKYTSGWWGQVLKKSETLGADDVFIGDMVDKIDGKYAARSGLWWLAGIASLCAAGALYHKMN